MSDLLPCPFCGGDAEIQENHNRTVYMGRNNHEPISVEILHWCSIMPGSLGRRSIVFAGRDRKSAIEMWNRRAQPAPDEAELTAAFRAGAEAMREQVLANLHAELCSEQIKRDACRRAQNWELYQVHGDRSSALQTAAECVRNLPFPTMEQKQ